MARKELVEHRGKLVIIGRVFHQRDEWHVYYLMRLIKSTKRIHARYYSWWNIVDLSKKPQASRIRIQSFDFDGLNAITRVVKVKGSKIKPMIWDDVEILHVIGEGNKKDPDYISVKDYRQLESDKKWITTDIHINKTITKNYNAANKSDENYAWRPDNYTLTNFRVLEHTPESNPGQTPSITEIRHITIIALFS